MATEATVTALERRLRDAGLDKTIEDSFPASDPPSTDPDPIDREAAARERSRTGGPEPSSPSMVPPRGETDTN